MFENKISIENDSEWQSKLQLDKYIHNTLCFLGCQSVHSILGRHVCLDIVSITLVAFCADCTGLKSVFILV